MKISKRVKNGYAMALAALLGMSGLSYMRTQAANGIEAREDCSVTISLSGSVAEGETAGVRIPVKLYKVAKVDASGKFTSLDGFPDMNEPDLDKDGKVTAEEWMTLADRAGKALTENSEVAGEAELVMEPEGSGESVSAEPVTIGNLGIGMYLVVPEEVYNDDYTVRYTFEPYLTALPGSEYAWNGSGSDEWIYQTEIGLKAEMEPETGSLRIVKKLETYNTSLGPVTCVFQVDGTDKSGKPYSNVISVTLNGSTEETLLENIPAGMEVTVTEVYAGASYELADADGETAVIISEEGLKHGINNGNVASVTFTNTYDEGNRSGNGVVNHFEKDGDGWNWRQLTHEPIR